MRQQSEQLTKALNEQTRAMREMTGASSDIAKQIKLITRANLEHSTGADSVLQMLSDVRKITERNAQGVQATLNETSGLIEQAQELSTIMNGFDSLESDAAPVDTPQNGEKSRGRGKKETAAADNGGGGNLPQNE